MLFRISVPYVRRAIFLLLFAALASLFFVSVNAQDPTQLDTPSRPTITGNFNDGYNVSWNAITNASNYVLRWREQGTRDWLQLARTGGATSHTIIPTVAQQGKTYQLRVRALSGDRARYLHSDSSQIATLIIPTQLDTPNRPTTSGDLDNGYTISWNAIANASNYVLRWREHGTRDWLQLARTSATSHTITSTVAQQGKTFELRVRALSGDRARYLHSDSSQIATLIIPIIPTQLDTPSQPTTSGDLDNGYTVSWNSITNASNYVLRWREQGTRSWLVVARTGGATSHTITPTVAQQGKTYQLRVRALSGDLARYLHSDSSQIATLIIPARLVTPVPTATNTPMPEPEIDTPD